ncbi:MAG: hypothetical protein ACNA8H_03095, partial [Anaerolineales bacterium]
MIDFPRKSKIKKIIIQGSILVLFLALVCNGLLYLAVTYPFQAGDPLFSLQQAAEQMRLRLTRNESRQMEFALDLAERRLADLAQADGHRQIELSANALVRALEMIFSLHEKVAYQQESSISLRLEALLTKVDIVVNSIQ